MDNKIKDNYFGEMVYKHSWTKIDTICLFDKAYKVKVVAQAYKGDTVLDIQRENYVNFRNYLEENKVAIEKKLKEYCKTNYNTDKPLDECLIPKTVIFERDGSWGILFDTEYDIENGVALFVINGQLEVGTEDLFL